MSRSIDPHRAGLLSHGTPRYRIGQPVRVHTCAGEVAARSTRVTAITRVVAGQRIRYVAPDGRRVIAVTRAPFWAYLVESLAVAGLCEESRLAPADDPPRATARARRAARLA